MRPEETDSPRVVSSGEWSRGQGADMGSITHVSRLRNGERWGRDIKPAEKQNTSGACCFESASSIDMPVPLAFALSRTNGSHANGRHFIHAISMRLLSWKHVRSMPFGRLVRRVIWAAVSCPIQSDAGKARGRPHPSCAGELYRTPLPARLYRRSYTGRPKKAASHFCARFLFRTRARARTRAGTVPLCPAGCGRGGRRGSPAGET